MTNFIKLALTEYDQDGAPAIGADDQWINLDQVTHIEEHLGNNLFRRHSLGGGIPEEHYPCLQLTTADGAKHLVSLGIYSDQDAAFGALANFSPLLVGPAQGQRSQIADRTDIDQGRPA